MRPVAIFGGLLLSAIALFLVSPQIDLAVSRWFYIPGQGFMWGDRLPVALVYRAVPWISWACLAVVAIGAIWLFLMDRPLWRLDRKALVFLVVSLAAGPGLLANTLLKDHWGRARPTQIEPFGGARQFTPAPLPAAECAENCAFVSGHAALGFSLVAFAFLLPRGGRRRAATAAALVIGAVIGLARVVQGAHFLSDVVFAGLLIYGTTALLYWWIVGRDGLAAPPLRRVYREFGAGAAAAWVLGVRALRRTAARAALAAIAAMIVIALSIIVIDRPVALFFHARDPDLRALFDLTGRLGLTYGYLTAFGLAFVGLHWGGRASRLRRFAHSMRTFSAIPAFLFLSIAASGIIVDLLKFIFGRPRPKLLFSSGAYDFAWLGLRPDHWSFPSGHSATIAALMTALWLLWPQHILFYALVAMIVALSRVVVGAHYVSDVFAGGLVAVLATRSVSLIFAKSGIDLAAARRGSGGAEEGLPWPCRRFGRKPTRGGRARAQEMGPVACTGCEQSNIAQSLTAAPESALTDGPSHRDF
jgi:lipid A 4'-phosphatase